MNRLHGLIVSLTLGAAAVIGAMAATQTMQLGPASATPTQSDRAAIRARARRLNLWEKSLRGSLAKRPPALPAVPRFGPVAVAGYGTAAPVVLNAGAPVVRATAMVKKRLAPVRPVAAAVQRSPRQKPPAATPAAPQPAEELPATTTAPTTTTTPEPTPPVTPVSAPAPPPVPTQPPPPRTTTGGSDDPPEPSDH